MILLVYLQSIILFIIVPMVTTITKETLWKFIMDISRKLEVQPAIAVDFLEDKELYINSEEYIAWRSDKEYDMSDSEQSKQFFIDLKNGIA